MFKLPKLSSKTRLKAAEKMMDWSNLVFVGLVLSQAFEGISGAFGRLLVGTIIMIITYAIALRVIEGGEK